MSGEENRPLPGGGWISGPCNGGPDEARNVVPPTDDEELDEEKLTSEDFWGGVESLPPVRE